MFAYLYLRYFEWPEELSHTRTAAAIAILFKASLQKSLHDDECINLFALSEIQRSSKTSTVVCQKHTATNGDTFLNFTFYAEFMA